MARTLLSFPRAMKFLQLTAVIRDIRTATMVAQPFFRSPVTVGRRDSNSLRLDATSVSRHHGAFIFSKRGLQYVDLSSANGSYLDGRPIESDRPVDIRDSSIITIGPFQIVVHLDLVALPIPPSDPEAATRVLREFAPPAVPAGPRPPPTIASGDRLGCATAEHAPADVLAQALEIVGATSDLIIRFRGCIDSAGTPLTSATTREEIVAYLLDPAGGPRRVDELRSLLTGMLRFPLTLVSGEAT